MEFTYILPQLSERQCKSKRNHWMLEDDDMQDYYIIQLDGYPARYYPNAYLSLSVCEQVRDELKALGYICWIEPCFINHTFNKLEQTI